MSIRRRVLHCLALRTYHSACYDVFISLSADRSNSTKLDEQLAYIEVVLLCGKEETRRDLAGLLLKVPTAHDLLRLFLVELVAHLQNRRRVSSSR